MSQRHGFDEEQQAMAGKILIDHAHRDVHATKQSLVIMHIGLALSEFGRGCWVSRTSVDLGLKRLREHRALFFLHMMLDELA